MIYTNQKNISRYNVVTNNRIFNLKYLCYFNNVIKGFEPFNIKLITTNDFILNIINKTYKLIGFN